MDYERPEGYPTQAEQVINRLALGVPLCLMTFMCIIWPVYRMSQGAYLTSDMIIIFGSLYTLFAIYQFNLWRE